MRKITLSTALTVVLLGGAMAGAGVIGTYGIVIPLVAGDPTAGIATTGMTRQVSIDGLVPVRLKTLVDGRLQPAQTGTVRFARNGRLAQQASVQGGGTVQVANLMAGPYSVFVDGGDGFAAFSTWLAPASVDAEAPSQILSVALVPHGDMPIVRQILRDHWRLSGPGVSYVSRETSEVALDSMRRFRSLAHGSQFQISPDGLLRGRVVRNPHPDDATPFERAEVYFVRSNRIMAQTMTDAGGLFQLRGIPTGVFSLVVVGEGSFLAMSVEVVPTPPAVASHDIVNEVSLVSLMDDTQVPEVSPVFPEDVVVAEDVWMADGESPDGTMAGGPPPGGGGAGAGGGGTGSAGGGGPAGGGSGLGPALAAGLIIGGSILIAEENDDDVRLIISNPNP